ncbi:hypothetical protein [Rhodococcus opacus]|uniref:hypothetical protein n=1 Tax=Rhodococcus opacus TaxID=37919 RepID=UPI0006BB5098|nr:hypothetical protein [Rhodococcus opacus]
MSARDVMVTTFARDAGASGTTSVAFASLALTALEANGYAVVQLPEEHFAGDYALAHIEGDEIHIDVCWIEFADDARKVPAALLRAADQLEKQLGGERRPDDGELDDGASADRAHDAAIDRGLGVL